MVAIYATWADRQTDGRTDGQEWPPIRTVAQDDLSLKMQYSML